MASKEVHLEHIANCLWDKDRNHDHFPGSLGNGQCVWNVVRRSHASLIWKQCDSNVSGRFVHNADTGSGIEPSLECVWLADLGSDNALRTARESAQRRGQRRRAGRY